MAWLIYPCLAVAVIRPAILMTQDIIGMMTLETISNILRELATYTTSDADGRLNFIKGPVKIRPLPIFLMGDIPMVIT